MQRRPDPGHRISADALRPIIERRQATGGGAIMGMASAALTHTYELRSWLHAGGSQPGVRGPGRP
jgi:nitrate/nitrite transport system substrate-binding protein